jgi:transcriptional regulator with XRE-family HTH domain
MGPRGRGISKSLRSTEHSVFCSIMIETRKKAGLTQQQLAKRLRKSQSFVAKYEGGERRIDVVEFLEVVRAMNADPLAVLRNLIHKTGQRAAGCWGVRSTFRRTGRQETPLTAIAKARSWINDLVGRTIPLPEVAHANIFSSLNTPKDHRVRVVRGPGRHINYR